VFNWDTQKESEMLRITGILFFFAVAIGNASAVEGIRYDRMLLACEERLMCRILVIGMEEFNLQYPRGISRLEELHRQAELIRKFYPRVWAAQYCPLGDCDSGTFGVSLFRSRGQKL
jgi:hypothetical protein